MYPQFLMYGCYLAAIAAVFLLAAMHTLASRWRSKPPEVPGDSGRPSRTWGVCQPELCPPLAGGDVGRGGGQGWVGPNPS